jgi:hypothetical protein
MSVGNKDDKKMAHNNKKDGAQRLD